MKTLASIILLSSAQLVSASELSLPQAPASVKVPAVSAPAASPILAEYTEYYTALAAYSDKAIGLKQDSPEFLETRTYGVYLRSRVEALRSSIGALAAYDRSVCNGLGSSAALRNLRAELGVCGGEKSLGAEPVRAAVSAKVSAELSGLLAGAGQKSETRGVPIKPGYCQINYVKNGVPFLVQQDGFLKKGEIIMTFDDGPGAVTAEFADAMAQAGAPSTFFVQGSKLGKSGKAIISSAAAAGHEIAVHGYWHATESGKPLTALTTETIVKQFSGVADTITSVTGNKPGLFRPPYGIITPEALKALDAQVGLVPVGWTVDTLDWSTKDPDQLLANTIAQIKQRGKGIVLMHDIHSQSRVAALKLVDWLKANGYKIVTPGKLTEAYRK